MKKANSWNRFLSMVLCICMVLSLTPVQVLALDACVHGDGCRSCPVQKLVDALPDEVTAENAEAVAAQLAAIDSEKASLTDEELTQVDFGKYTSAISAINDLAGQAGTPEAVAEDASDFNISDGVLIRYLGSAESVEIPDGVTEIGQMAFYGNSSVISVKIPNSVTTIGLGAFRNAKYLRSVNIPASVTSIGEQAFYGTDIRALSLPDSLTSIGEKAFYQSSLVTLDFFNTGNRADLVIGKSAFQGSIALSSVELASVSHIDSYAFYGCSNLTTLEYRGTTIPTRGSQPLSETQVSEVYVTDAYTSNSFCGIPVSVEYYSITFSAEPSRGGYAFRDSYEPSIGRVGASISLDAISCTGYNFVGWKYEGEIVSTAQFYSFKMPAKAVTYIAVFEKNHTCDNTTYTDAGNGTHSYECSVCGVNTENHSFDTSSSCTVCGAACKHESYTDGTCTACGVACGHSFDTEGRCTVCGGYEPAVLSSSVYQISNTGQLFWFAELVNEGSTGASAVLTADITIPAGMNWTPIGNASQPYRGTFNGGDHTISGLYFSDDSADYIGLFGIVESTGKIQNTGLVETSIMAKKSVGTVAGYCLGTVECCWAENITVSATANLGGVVGFNRGTVNNCWISGDVTMRNTSNSAGGIVGYNYGTVSNCFTLAGVTGTARQGALIGTVNKHESLSAAGSITNCYYDSSTTAVAVANIIDGTVTDVSSKTTETFASGEVAYLLGEAWGQTIGTDSYPALKGAKVYQVTNCKGDTAYSNTDESGTHTEQIVTGKAPTCTEPGLTDGVICTVCGETLTAQEEIPAGHKLTQVGAQAPTCTEPGWEAYEYCTECDYTTKVELPATGEHVFGDGDYICDCGAAFNGIYEETNGDLYYVENGAAIENKGLVQVVDGNGHIHYYYFGCGIENCSAGDACQGNFKAQKSSRHYASVTNGYLVEGGYTFNDDGTIEHIDDTSVNGIYEIDGVKYCLMDGVKVAKGLFEQDGKFYYARSSGALVVGQSYWVSKTNGLTLNGEPIKAGAYTFDETGALVFPEDKNGFYFENGGWYYYVDNQLNYAGLIYCDGPEGNDPGYYYVNSKCQLVTDCAYWISKNNGYMKNTTYHFDENGTMYEPAPKNGFYFENDAWYYYVDGELNYAGLIWCDGPEGNDPGYYYVNSKCMLITGCDYWISKNNGYMMNQTYTFDANGTMVRETGEDGLLEGIVEENGELYYYEDGIKTYAGLILIDGDYYYVNSKCKVVTNCTYWISKNNGYMSNGNYTFDETGKMIRN